jgi:hypothetical protein
MSKASILALGTLLLANTHSARAELLDWAHLLITGPAAALANIETGFKRCGMRGVDLRTLKNGRSFLEVRSRDPYSPVVLGPCPEAILKPYKRIISMRQIPASTD